MSRDVALVPRHAGAYLLIGLIVTPGTLLLLLTGETGMLTWMGLGLGLACLLVGTAQRSSLHHQGDE
jgi:hypothetical protein